jgi:hypothetical protein
VGHGPIRRTLENAGKRWKTLENAGKFRKVPENPGKHYKKTRIYHAFFLIPLETHLKEVKNYLERREASRTNNF